MIKAVIRTALVAALAVGILGSTQSVRAGEKKAEHKKGDVFHGAIEAVDAAASTVTVKNNKDTKTFVVNADTDLTDLGKDAKLADLKVGEKVKIHLKPDTTPLVATKIEHAEPKAKEKKNK